MEPKVFIHISACSYIIAGSNPPSSFFISCFTISLTPLISRPEFSNDSTILIISSISSFEINNPALNVPCPVFYSNLSNTEEVVLVTNLGKTSLAKGTARSNNTFLPSLLNVLPRNAPD